MPLEPGGPHPDRKGKTPGSHPQRALLPRVVLSCSQQRGAHTPSSVVAAAFLVAVHVDAVDEMQPRAVDERVFDGAVLDHASLDAVVVQREFSAYPELLASVQPLPAFGTSLPRLLGPVLETEAEEIFLVFGEVDDLHGDFLTLTPLDSGIVSITECAGELAQPAITCAWPLASCLARLAQGYMPLENNSGHAGRGLSLG